MSVDAAKKKLFRCAGRYVRDDEGVAACDYEEERFWPWSPPCPKCGGWYDAEQVGGDREKSVETNFAAKPSAKTEKRLATRIPELDAILNGGFAYGATVLWGGPPGSGKTTLTIQVAAAVATVKHPVLFVSKEQSADAVLATAQRIGCKNEHVHLLGDEGDLQKIMARAKELKAALLVVDSIQKIARASFVSPSDVVEAFMDFAKKNPSMVVILISQVTNDLSFTGGKSLEHDTDTVVFMGAYDIEEDKLRLYQTRKIEPRGKYRFLVLEKNRSSPDDQKLLFRMFDTGLSIVKERKFPSLVTEESREE